MLGADMLERDVLLLGLDIDERGVPLIEGSAPSILAAQPHRNTLLQKRAKRQGLGHSEIQSAPAAGHLEPLIEKLLHLGVNVESLGIFHKRCPNGGQFFLRNGRIYFERSFIATAAVTVPVTR